MYLIKCVLSFTCVVFLVPQSMFAQTVSGRLVDGLARVPIDKAVIVLLDDAGPGEMGADVAAPVVAQRRPQLLVSEQKRESFAEVGIVPVEQPRVAAAAVFHYCLTRGAG